MVLSLLLISSLLTGSLARSVMLLSGSGVCFGVVEFCCCWVWDLLGGPLCCYAVSVVGEWCCDRMGPVQLLPGLVQGQVAAVQGLAQSFDDSRQEPFVELGGLRRGAAQRVVRLP